MQFPCGFSPALCTVHSVHALGCDDDDGDDDDDDDSCFSSGNMLPSLVSRVGLLKFPTRYTILVATCLSCMLTSLIFILIKLYGIMTYQQHNSSLAKPGLERLQCDS